MAASMQSWMIRILSPRCDGTVRTPGAGRLRAIPDSGLPLMLVFAPPPAHVLGAWREHVEPDTRTILGDELDC
jgi:hypothetical protein